MVLVTPELCCRYPALISPNFNTHERVLLHHFPELQKQVEMEGRGEGRRPVSWRRKLARAEVELR